jgi:hypothetical protein
MKIYFLLAALLISSDCFSQNSDNQFDRKKMVTIGNLYGYARYFNPNKNLNKFNWTKFLMHTIRETDKINQNNDALNHLLYQLFSPLIPDMQLFVSDQLMYGEKLQNIPPFDKNKKVYMWEHKGFGGIPYGGILNLFVSGNPYKSQIIHTKWNPHLPVPDSLYSFIINCDGLIFKYPLAVSKQTKSKDRELKMLKAATDTIDIRLSTSSFFRVLFKRNFGNDQPILYQDKSLYMASLIERWAVVRHFYPYLEEDGYIAGKMDDLLSDFTERVDNELNQFEGREKMYQFLQLMREFMGSFNDLHITQYANITGVSSFGTYLREYKLSMPIDYIEDSFVFSNPVLSVQDKEIKRGDKLIAVNYIPIDTFISMRSKFISASTEKTKMLRLTYDAFSTSNADSIFHFSFLNEKGDTVTFSKRAGDLSGNASQSGNKPFVRKIEDGIYYMDLSSNDCDKKNFLKFVNETPDLRHLIFDVRNRPNNKSFDFFNHLSINPIEWGDYRIPIRYFPNQENEIWDKDEEKIMPKNPTAVAKYYALINEHAVSYGESVAGMFKRNNLALLIGENTSGTNGDASYIVAPY